MSEAMTNPEIEDVLASIRRLVAQDRRPRPERLILTEEFRIRQANIPAPPLTLAAPISPEAAVAEVVAAVVAEDAPGPEVAARLEDDLRALEARLPPAPPPAEAAIPPAPAEDLAEAVQVDAPRPAPQPAPSGAASAEIVGDDVAFIDEADLERLVARIVRDELRGQLGERITQQVRKLVRAEIARALDERNLLG